MVAGLMLYLIKNPTLRAGELQDQVNDLLVTWLRHPDSYGGDHKPLTGLQRREYFQRFVNLIAYGVLNVEADREAIGRFLQWVNQWEPENKTRVERLESYPIHNYFPPEL